MLVCSRAPNLSLTCASRWIALLGLPKEFDLKKILKALKKEYCCNGCVIDDEEQGRVLQLQGDQRKNVVTFIVENKLGKKDNIKIHGF